MKHVADIYVRPPAPKAVLVTVRTPENGVLTRTVYNFRGQCWSLLDCSHRNLPISWMLLDSVGRKQSRILQHPHDEAYRLILYRSYDIKMQKRAILGRNVPNLSHLPENIHKRFCAHPAEKQDALFCCSVNFHHWRYGFESLSPVLTDKTAAISEGKFRRGGHTLPRRLL